MESPVAVGGHGGGLSLHGPGGRKEWRVVSESSGREAVVADGSRNQARMSGAGPSRSNSGASRRSIRNGQIFHPGCDGRSSDLDHHGGDIGIAYLMGTSVTPQELIPQIIGQGEEAVLYEEMHRSQQRNELLDSALNPTPTDSGLGSMENPDEALQQRLHEVSRQREQLQQAEIELRAQFIARSEVILLQNGLDEQSKKHSELTSNLQAQVQEREQQIHHLEQQLEERERQLHVNQMETNEAVWAKDGLLREQTNELTTLRRDRDNAITEHQTVAAQLDAERAEHTQQLEDLKEQVREKDRLLQETEEQSRSTQDVILYKDEQLREAQAWMARAQELDTYHANTNNTLHGELRERTEQIHQLWLGYQRQLADIERYHAQLIQRLQQEVTDAREQISVLKGPAASDRLDGKEERLSVAQNKEVGRFDANDDPGIKGNRILMAVSPAHNRSKSNVITNGNMEGLLPVLLPHDALPSKIEPATGLSVVPAPVLGIASVLPPPGPTTGIHQFGMRQQGIPPNQQPSIVQVPLPPLGQLQPMAAVLASQQHPPLLHHQQVLHHHHHHPQQHQSSQAHRLPQRSQTQPMQQQASQPPQLQHSPQVSSLQSQGEQTRHQELHRQHQEQTGQNQGVTKAEQQKLLVSQSSPMPLQQLSHGQPSQQQQQKASSQLLHLQQQSLPTLPVVVSEQTDIAAVAQQSQQEEHQQALPSNLQQQQAGQEQQEPELNVQHQQSNQQERQPRERHRLDSHLQQFSHQQPKQSQGQGHQLLLHENNVGPQPQQLQHQQGIASSMGHLAGAPHPSSISQEVTSSGRVGHDVTGCKSPLDKQELQKSAKQILNQPNFGDASCKGAEPVLLDERSLLACLVRAIPAEPSSRIRISSTLPNRLGKMLAPLHWHDYRKQYGRLDEFVGSHAELFVIDGDFINLQEGAHATFSATTAVAKAEEAAAAVTPAGPTRMPTVAVTPVAQSTLLRGRSLKGSSTGHKESKVGPVTTKDIVFQPPSSPQTGSSRQIQTPIMGRSGVENENANLHHSIVNLGGTVKTSGKAESQPKLHGGGSRTNGVSSIPDNDNSVNFDGGINGYVPSARGIGYYGSRQLGRGSLLGSGQYKKQENQIRPQSQEGRSAGSASNLSQ